MSEKGMKIAVIGYALIGVLTFGIAWNNQYNGCIAQGTTNPNLTPATCEAAALFAGAINGAAWPLYLSVQMFKEDA